MGRPWAALLGALALRASSLSHSRFGELDLGEVEDFGQGDHAASFEGTEASWDDAPPGRGRAAAARPRPPAATRARPRPPVQPRPAAPKAVVPELARTEAMPSSLKNVSLVLLGTEPKHMELLEEGYRPFFREVIFLQWVSDEEMESLQEAVGRRHPVVLSRRTEDTDVTTGGVTDISIDLASTDTDSGAHQDMDGGAHLDLDSEAAAAEILVGKPVDDEFLDGARSKDVPWQWLVKDVAGPLKRRRGPGAGRTVFGCLKKKKHIYHAVCLPEVLKYIAKQQSDSRGVLVSTPEFWFNPVDLMGVNAGLNLDGLWQLGGAGLRGENLEKLGTKCWDSFKDISADSTWQWHDTDKDKHWNAAVLLWEARNYKSLKSKPKPQACIGWADAYFLPTSTWAAAQQMLPIMNDVRFEVAVPTMLNYLTKFEKHRSFVDDRCWGGCCFMKTRDKSLLSKHVCGSRMDLSDTDMKEAWKDLMFNASMRLLSPGAAKYKLSRRYNMTNFEAFFPDGDASA